MTKEERLLLAMSEIDDSLIEEAATPYKSSGAFLRRIVGCAAIFAIATVTVIGIRTIRGSFGGGSFKGSSDNNYTSDYEENLDSSGNDYKGESTSPDVNNGFDGTTDDLTPSTPNSGADDGKEDTKDDEENSDGYADKDDDKKTYENGTPDSELLPNGNSEISLP